MNREEFIKQLIENKYGNVRAFSREVDIPYTTIRSILERGIGKASVDIVIKMCKYLGISPEDISEESITFNKEITGTIANLVQLVPKRQASVFEFSNQQLELQKKNITPIHQIDISNKEPYTLAAHSVDPNANYDDEYLDKLNSYLDEVDEKFEKREKKKD